MQNNVPGLAWGLWGGEGEHYSPLIISPGRCFYTVCLQLSTELAASGDFSLSEAKLTGIKLNAFVCGILATMLPGFMKKLCEAAAPPPHHVLARPMVTALLHTCNPHDHDV